MKKIYLITGNPGKVESFNKILKNKNYFSINIEIYNGDYPEIKDDGTTQQVVLEGAKYCSNNFNKDVLVQDTGLFIHSLHGFPGVNTKFCLERIGNEGILKLMEGKNNREAEWIFSIGYCEIGGEAVEFTGILKGKISEKCRGNLGFGFDEIFIPQGYNSTFGENIEIRDKLSPFHETIDTLIKYLNLKKEL